MHSSAQDKTILLVDDNDDLRELYSATLRREGYVVCEAENGRMALDILRSRDSHPCLVLLDLMMPVMSGAELLKALEGSGDLENLPVIVLSAGGRPSDAPGAQQFIRKPVDANVLIKLVRDFCDSHPAT